MANHGIMLGWNRPITGREADAGELFQQSIGYWTKLQKDGMIENFEPVLIERHGGAVHPAQRLDQRIRFFDGLLHGNTLHRVSEYIR